MLQALPYDGMRWMAEEELSNWRYIPCLLVVDRELHDLHSDYPLAPKKVKVGKVHKLIPNLNNKKKYVIHHEALNFYLDHGLELTKIHRGIAFEECDWMKSYIDLNTNLRAQATNEFDKDNFKLMNNAVLVR